MNESTILSEFLSDPDGLYAAPESKLNTPGARSELFQIEESLVAVLRGEQRAELRRQPGADWQAEHEEAVAALADRIALGEELPAELNPEVKAAAYRSYLDGAYLRRLEGSPDTSLPVPAALLAVVERGFAAPARPGRAVETPAIVLSLAAGLRVVKSALQGLRLTDETLLATRNAVAPAAPGARTSGLTMHQAVPAAGIELEYQILSESEDSVTLLVRCPPGDQRTRVDLRKDGRILDSRTCAGDQQSVSFERLRAGAYQLEFTGSFAHILGILIEP